MERLRSLASQYYDHALTAALAEAFVDLGKARVCAEAWQQQLNNFRLLDIEAKPPRLKQ